jgi:hypothetical protein
MGATVGDAEAKEIARNTSREERCESMKNEQIHGLTPLIPLGYFSFSGNLDCCIIIRTALIKDGRAYVQAGGGWVNDSTPEGEYQETVNKAKAMLKALAMAATFAKPG